MDVRCERCRAQYVFDDDQITPQGLTVQCTNCGHVFRVKKKELVVTVPVRPEDVTGHPLQASDASLRPGAHPEPSAGRTALFESPVADAARQPWLVRQADGVTLTFAELGALQRWVVDRKVSRDDEVSQGGSAWGRLGDLEALRGFFALVEEAGRARASAPLAPKPTARPGGTDFYPPPPFPPPSFANLPAIPQPQPPPAAAPQPPRPSPAPAPPPRRDPAPAPRAPADAALLTTELGPEELAAIRGRSTGRTRLAVGALLLVTAGAVGYVFLPALLGHESAPLAVPPPAPPPAAPAPRASTVEPEVKAPPEAARPAVPQTAAPLPEEKPAPPPAPEPVVEPPPQRSPEPAAAPAPPKPPTAKALLAQARKARAAGEPARALDLFGKVLAAEPDNVDAQTGRGLCYFELGQYGPAESSFQRALQLDLEYPDAIMGLAETYRQQGKKRDALGLFERYLALHPNGEEAAVARYAISQLKE